jgi:hypothetical protein
MWLIGGVGTVHRDAAGSQPCNGPESGISRSGREGAVIGGEEQAGQELLPSGELGRQRRQQSVICPEGAAVLRAHGAQTLVPGISCWSPPALATEMKGLCDHSPSDLGGTAILSG